MDPSAGGPASIHAAWRLAVAGRVAAVYAGNPDLAVSNFLTGTIDRFLDDVLLRVSTEPVRHMRLAAVQRCQPLIGAEVIESWRTRAAEFPDNLVSTLVEEALAPEALSGWGAREALVSRGDYLALTGLRASTGQAVVRAVLALNRVYLPHRQLKRQRQLTVRPGAGPFRGTARAGSAGPPEQALPAVEGLLAEVTDLAEAHSGASLGEFRATLAERRQSIDPPPGSR